MTATTLNGHDYSTDGSATRDMVGSDGYGYQEWLIPMWNDGLAEIGTRTAAVGTSLVGTSSTNSVAIGTGTKTLTVDSPSTKGFAANMWVVCTDAGNSANSMTGSVTSYNATTGALVISVPAGGTTGSGTPSSWTIGVSGKQGAAGTFAVATAAEAATGTDNTKAVSPLALAGWVPALTELTSGQVDTAADFIPIYDASGTVVKKVKPANLGAGGGFSDSTSISTNTTLSTTHLGKMLEVTGSSAVTLSVTPSTIGKGSFAVQNNASSTVQVTCPATINGASGALYLPSGAGAIVTSDGTKLVAVVTAAALTGTTWNPADRSATAALSNLNRTMTAPSGGPVYARCSPAIPTGSYVLDIHLDTVTSFNIGIATAAASLSNYIGFDANGWTYDSGGAKAHNGPSGYGAAPVTGDIIRIAVTIPSSGTGKVWWARNNVWQGGGDPVAGTGAAFSDVGLLVYIAANIGASSSITILASPAYPLPSGFNYLP